jgi:hypothetical protein
VAIELLTVCEWKGTGKQDLEFVRPSWTEVEYHIRALNNRNLNDLYLHPKASELETYLCVGGGNGRYVVTGAMRSETFPTLVDHTRAVAPKQRLVVGGQEGLYPANWIMDLEAVLHAAHLFYDAGAFTDEVAWTNA